MPQRPATWQLFAVCVLIWGTTWYAITFQVDRVPAEAAVALRFGLAGAAVLAFCAARRAPLRFPPSTHARLALQGALLYGVSYVCVYHAEKHIASGLVAVGYSASPLVSGLGARWLFGTRVSARFVAGGVLGLVGVALIFWPEFESSAQRSGAALGALFTLASVLLSSGGSLAASRNRGHGLPFWPALGYGMLYGAAAAALCSLVLGERIAWPSAPLWWGSLLYLALAGSVLAFACFLALQQRLGPGPAGTVGVMTPLLALAVSITLEGLRPHALTFAGLALAVAGNVLMLRPPRSRG
ncbi:MAG TPA: EamA family transporter [Burkholderiaceae bacterium]|nr:EamA family transporter [Burkholderiaceae bacterium]